jgi:hypothetical protein
MNNEEQLKRLKELKKNKNEILNKINKENISLLNPESNLETLLKSLSEINSEQKKIWKERHKVRRLKYDQSEKGKELARIRAIENYYKNKAFDKGIEGILTQ